VSEQLDKIVNEIEAAQISIAQQQTKEGIKKLLECMKKLASAIDGAVEDISKPSNSESLEKPFPNREKPFPNREKPFPNQALYKSFQAKVGKLPDSSTFDKNALIKRLNNEQSQLANLSKIRNKSAHANLKGEENEVNREEYIDLANKVSTVIDTLFIVKLNMQSL
jgi:hypothetical protein